MTAADRREELEAVIHAQLTRAWKYGLRAPSDPKDRGTLTPAQAILAAADAYATSLAAEETDRLAGRERLAIATAERTGRTS